MTLFLDFRSDATGGAIVDDPKGWKTTTANPETALSLTPAEIAKDVGGKRVLFAVHGFNVSWKDGLKSGVNLEEDLRSSATPFPLTEQDVFVGVLWPGDWWVKIVNYPWEAFDAVKAGRLLAGVINRYFASAQNVSFVSHSLGARLVLAAAEGVVGEKRVEHIILTAPAADNDCLVRQHAVAHRSAKLVHVLSSKRDMALKFAYPVGDFLSDVFGDDDNPFGAALGYRGPAPPAMDRMMHVWIPGKPRNQGKKSPSLTSDYDHTDYFPGTTFPRQQPKQRKSDTVSRYIGAAFAGEKRWP